jgi:hypothetical protein
MPPVLLVPITDGIIRADDGGRRAMKRRLIVLIVIFAALIVCYGILIRVAPVPKLRDVSTASASDGALEDPGEYEEVTVEIEIPSVSEFPAAWAQGGGCPHIVVVRTLGAQVSSSGGVRVLAVEPDKPAAKAGIQVDDRLGKPGDCVNSLYRSFAPRKEARTVEWTVRRPKGATAEGEV